MRRNRLFALFTLAAVTVAGAARAQDAKTGFAIKDTPGDHLDVLLDGKVAARYMYAHDTSSKERTAETYKPYLHVFDADGKAPITKGAGGDFPHHRGIYIGWNKISFGGKSYDRWHMKGGDQVHQKFTRQAFNPGEATFTSVVLWQADSPDKAIIEEERTTIVRRAPAPGRITIDFRSKLKAPNGDVKLDGDPEHAGIHFRPAQEVSRKDTTYLYPKERADAHKDVDYPWVGESFTVGGKRHSVVHINHPSNPTGTRYSAYRDYGRFGAFPKAEIKSGEALTVQYRFVIADGEMPPAETIQKWADDFTGASSPTPTPPTTAKPAEGAGRTPGGNKAATKPAAKPAAK